MGRVGGMRNAKLMDNFFGGALTAVYWRPTGGCGSAQSVRQRTLSPRFWPARRNYHDARQAGDNFAPPADRCCVVGISNYLPLRPYVGCMILVSLLVNFDDEFRE
jgi:hypothetical protein